MNEEENQINVRLLWGAKDGEEGTLHWKNQNEIPKFINIPLKDGFFWVYKFYRQLGFNFYEYIFDHYEKC